MNSTLENQFNSELRAHFESAKTTQAQLFRLSLMADSVVGEAQKPGEFGPPFPTMSEIREALEQIRQYMENLASMIKSRSILEKEKGSTFETRAKHVAEAVKSFGTTRYSGAPGENARDFWSQFRDFLNKQGYKQEQVANYALPLLKTLVTAPNAAAWFDNDVETKFSASNPVTVEGLERIFIKGWLDSFALSMENSILHIFAWGGKEDGTAFKNRMASIYRRLNIDMGANRIADPTVGNLIEELLNRLPSSVRQSSFINSKDPREYENLQQLLQDIADYPGIPTDLAIPAHVCFFCSKEVSWSCNCENYKSVKDKRSLRIKENRTMSSSSTNSNSILKDQCSTHPGSNHSNADCRSRKRARQEEPQRIPVDKKREFREKGLCFNGCGERYTFEHPKVCPKAPKKGDVRRLTGLPRTQNSKGRKGESAGKFAKMDVDPEEELIISEKDLEDINALEQGFFKALPELEKNPLIRVPILINGKRVLGVLDTYSTWSFLDPSLVEDLGLKGQKVKPVSMQLGNGRWVVNDVGVRTKVQSNQHEFEHEFRVMELHSHNRTILGLDLFYKLDLQVQNLPPKWPVIQLDLKRTPDRRDNKNSDFYLRHKIVLDPLIQENEALRGPCTHPLALIAFETKPGVTINVRQYPVPFKQHEIVDQQIEKWIKEDHIREDQESQNVEWNLPLLVAPKKALDGSIKGWRVCLDPRLVNNIMRHSAFPIPLIEDILSTIRGKDYYTKIDLRQGFHQFKIREEDRKKTSFTWKGKRYMFVVAPFGYSNIPNEYQRIVQAIVGQELLRSFAVLYIDDIIIHSNSETEHLEHVKEVLKTLTNNGLRIQREKLEIGVRECDVLGHTVSKDGCTIAVEKLLAIEGWQKPTRGKMIAQQLGFFNFFRGLVPLYARIVAPLDKLRNQEKIDWKLEHQEVYDKLIMIMKSGLILKNPDFTKPMFVATDASKYGIGGILYQKDYKEDKSWTPRYIKFVSRALSGAEINYGATKRELLAIVYSLEKLGDYLWGNRFTVETDHNALTFMFTQKKINSTIANWLETLLDYDFAVVHCPGVKHILPDAISRFYDEDNPNLMQQESAFRALTEVDEVDALSGPNLENVLDLEERTRLIERAHLMGHFGAAAMAKAIQNDGFSWSGIKDECQREVLKCIPCQRYNIGRHGYHPLKNLKALMPFDHVTIDLKEMTKSKRNNTFYLLLIDVATRFVFLRPLVNKQMDTVAQALFGLFCDVGFPVIISMDNGTEFVNQLMQEIVRISQMDRRLFTPYHHRGNGLAERAVRTTSDAIYKLLEGRDNEWDQYIPSTQLFMNLKVSEMTGSTPYSLMYARSVNKFMEINGSSTLPANIELLKERLDYMTQVVYPGVRTRSEKIHAKRNSAFEKNNQIRHESFPDGTMVMVRDENRNGKSEPRYEGPFTILRRNKGGVYVLKGRDGTEYTRPGQVLKIVHPKIADISTDEPVGVVDKILSHRLATSVKGKNEHYYLVKWKETDIRSWVIHSDFHDHGPIRRYWQNLHRLEKLKGPSILGQDERDLSINLPNQNGNLVDVETISIPKDHLLDVALSKENEGMKDSTSDSQETDQYAQKPDDVELPKELQSALSSKWGLPVDRKRKRSVLFGGYEERD